MTDPIQDIPISPAYQALLDLTALEHPARTRYRDVTHFDRASLAHNPERYVLILGDNFSHLCLYRGELARCAVRQYADYASVRYYAYDGQLRQVAPAEAEQLTETLPGTYQLECEHGQWWIVDGPRRLALTPEQAQTVQHLTLHERLARLDDPELRWDSRYIHSEQLRLRALAAEQRRRLPPATFQPAQPGL